MSSDQPNLLTDDGARRRDQMLGELLDAMQRVHAQRRTRRRLILASAAAVPIVAFAAIGTLWLAAPNAQTDAPESAAGFAANESGNPQSDPIIVRVTTDATVLERLAAPAVRSSAIILDDDMLLNELAAIDRPAGLVRSEDRVWLTRNVTDDPRQAGDRDRPSSRSGTLDPPST